MSAAKRAKDKELANHSACPCGSSSDAYTEYEDGHGFCYSCHKPFGTNQLKPDNFERKLVDGYRGISKEACEFVGVWSYVDDDDNVIFREYVAPDGKKFRRCPKEGMWQEGTYPALGGTWLWNAGSSHYVTVLEGEEDAAAFYDMMMKGKKTKYPFVWLTSAGIPKRGRKAIYDYLSKFETIKLAFESDEAGQNAKNILREMLPNKIREVPLTKHKDANEYLIAGDGDEFKRSWENAQLLTPENIYHTEDDVRKVLENEEVESYVPTGFTELNGLIRGLPLNHVTLITGLEGIGKTEFLRSLEYETLKAGHPIAVLHHEETKKNIYKGLACYELDKNVRDPDNPVPITDTMNGLRVLTDGWKNLFVLEFKSDPDVDTILEQIKYLVHTCGVRYIFIDPINQFDPVDDTTKVDFLDDLSKRVAKYVSNNPVGMVWTAHVNDEGRTRDSRMISKACSIRIDLFRDVLNTDVGERNTTYMYVSKNRPFGTTGFGGTAAWDNATFIMEEGFGNDDGPDDSIPFEGTDVDEEEPEEDEVVVEDTEPKILPFE